VTPFAGKKKITITPSSSVERIARKGVRNSWGHLSMRDRFQDSTLLLSNLAKKVPNEFLQSIWARTRMQPGKSLLELGCGSGELTAWFALKGIVVAGVDLSEAMVKMAQQQFPSMAQQFHHAEAIDFMRSSPNPWDIIVSFESMHLWLNDPSLPNALKRALIRGGFLVVAWRTLEWENICRDVIVDALTVSGVQFYDWGYWTCPNLADVLERTAMNYYFQAPVVISVRHSSTAKEVVEFVLGIDRVQDLSEEAREQLATGLHKRIEAVCHGGRFVGDATYSAQVAELSDNSRMPRSSH